SSARKPTAPRRPCARSPSWCSTRPPSAAPRTCRRRRSTARAPGRRAPAARGRPRRPRPPRPPAARRRVRRRPRRPARPPGRSRGPRRPPPSPEGASMTPHRPATVRGGFTLLEVMLATAIALLLLVALYMSFEIYINHVDQGRRQIEQGTLARSLFTHIEA